MIGHGGEDWGSGFPGADWIPELNLSLIVGLNMGEKGMGMNTSLTRSDNGKLIQATFCRMFDALLAFRGKGRSADCTKLMPKP